VSVSVKECRENNAKTNLSFIDWSVAVHSESRHHGRKVGDREVSRDARVRKSNRGSFRLAKLSVRMTARGRVGWAADSMLLSVWSAVRRFRRYLKRSAVDFFG
jgi:hypothetical protein